MFLKIVSLCTIQLATKVTCPKTYKYPTSTIVHLHMKIQLINKSLVSCLDEVGNAELRDVGKGGKILNFSKLTIHRGKKFSLMQKKKGLFFDEAMCLSLPWQKGTPYVCID